jgi:Fe2+ transport system protein FeoA
MNLSLLKPGESGIIESVSGEGALRRRLLDMGLTPGTRVGVRKVAPFGDPLELSLRGYELTLRGEDAKIIQMRKES